MKRFARVVGPWTGLVGLGVSLVAVCGASTSFTACSSSDRPAAGTSSGSSTDRSGGGSSGTADASAIDAGNDAGGVCTNIDNLGNLVDLLAVPSDPPITSGGTISEGTYTLTDATRFVGTAGTPGQTGISYKATLKITSGLYQRVLETQTSTLDAGGPVEARDIGSIVVNGLNASLVQTCPVSITTTDSYTATDTTLVLVNNLTKERLTYLKK